MSININNKIIMFKIFFLITTILFLLTIKVEAATTPFECYYYKNTDGSLSSPIIIRYDGSTSKISGIAYNSIDYKETLPKTVNGCPSIIYGITTNRRTLDVYTSAKTGSIQYNLKYKFTKNSVEFDCTYHFKYDKNDSLYANLTLKYINGTIKYNIDRSEPLKTGEANLTLSYDISNITKDDFISSGKLTCPDKTLYQVTSMETQKDKTTLHKRTYSFKEPEVKDYFSGTLLSDTTMTSIMIDYNTLQKGTEPTLKDVKCGPYEYKVGPFVRQITVEYVGEQILASIVDLQNGVPAGNIGLGNYTFDTDLIKSSTEYSKRECGKDLYYYITTSGVNGNVTLSYTPTNLTKSYMTAEGSNKADENTYIDPTSGKPIDCSDFVTDEGVNIISDLFNIIMIIGPILALVLGGVDFAKATLASDENALKKAGTNFSKRIIAAILLFLLPMIINLVLGLAFNAGVFGNMEKAPEVCLIKK